MATLSHLLRHPSGEFIEKTLDGKIMAEGQTLTCTHCGQIWQVKPGSGIERGWCFRCNGPTCGAKACTERCLPFERQLEIAEQSARLWAVVRGNLGVKV